MIYLSVREAPKNMNKTTVALIVALLAAGLGAQNIQLIGAGRIAVAATGDVR